MDELELWKALTCFGEKQVKHILQEPEWRERFPDVFERLESKDDRVKYDTMIPFIMLRAMASLRPHQYAFGLRDDVVKCYPRKEDFSSDYVILSSLEVLERFGGEALFESVDYGTTIIKNR